MDPVNFGRWIADCRRAGGWRSQRALIEALRADFGLREHDISEDFLARLEAGQLAYPLRPAMRRRVLLLTWLLCKDTRDLQGFLRTAELTDLAPEEREIVCRVTRYLGALETPARAVLPPRPARLFGRGTELTTLTQALSTIRVGVCSVTGMPGIGKSALAAEAVHLVAADTRLRVRRFPDGVATFTCTERHGSSGLIALLEEITSVFSWQPNSLSTARAVSAPVRPPSDAGTHPARDATTSLEMLHGAQSEVEALADALHHARMALADKRCLLILDDLSPRFRLREALEALLAQEQAIASREEDDAAGRVVLVNSRHLLPRAAVTCHVHLWPLDAADAQALFLELAGREFDDNQQEAVEQICAAVGYLPEMIELAAMAVAETGIPPALLACRLAADPLGAGLELEREGESRMRIARVVASLTPAEQTRLTLLSALGISGFTLEAAAAISAPFPHERRAGVAWAADASAASEGSAGEWLPIGPLSAHGLFSAGAGGSWEPRGDATDEARTNHLAETAAHLSQLVRHSLLDVSLASSPVLDGHMSLGPYYVLHPVIRAVLTGEQDRLDADTIHAAQRSAWEYALECVTRQPTDIERLARERDFVLAVAALAQRQRQYAVVAQLVRELAWFPGLLGREPEAERVLRWGVEANQQLGDRTQVSCLIDSLGDHYYLRGALPEAREAFEQSLRMTESLERPPAFTWDALVHLAQLAMLERDYEAARRFTERYHRHAQDAGDARSVIIALQRQAEVALLIGDRTGAYQTCTAALDFVVRHLPDGCPLIEHSIQAMLARLGHDTERARIHTKSAVSITERLHGPYHAIKLLVAQASYEQQYGEMDAVVGFVRQAQEISRRVGLRGLGVYRGMVADLLSDRPPSRKVSMSRRDAAEDGAARATSMDERALVPLRVGGEIPRAGGEIPRVRGGDSASWATAAAESALLPRYTSSVSLTQSRDQESTPGCAAAADGTCGSPLPRASGTTYPGGPALRLSRPVTARLGSSRKRSISLEMGEDISRWEQQGGGTMA